MSSMLPDLPDVDWSDPDVRRVLGMLGWKYEQEYKENAGLKRANAEKDRRIAELEAQVRALQHVGAEGAGGRARLQRG